MKAVVLIIAALYAAPLWAVVPVPVPDVAVVNRITIEGFVCVQRNAWAWAGDQSEVDLLEDQHESPYRAPLAKLVFATEPDYREALRNDGFIVRVEGFEVCRGAEKLLCVESVRTVVK